MRYLLVRAKLVLVALFLSLGTFALSETDCFPSAKKGKLVHDFAGIIDSRDENRLERQLVNFNDTTSTQITIITLNDLCGYEASQMAIQIGENWGVGNAKFDNGVVILVKPKIGSSRGHAFIASGYGLEGILPDITLNRIVDTEMIPQFKKNDYYGGLQVAINRIIEIAGGEYSAEDYNSRGKGDVPLFPFIFIFFVMILIFASTISRAKRYARRNNMGLWTALWLMGSMNSRHRGHYDNFTSGGGGFGGFGSGGSGFGGFGGGSFGGGGAGGSW